MYRNYFAITLILLVVLVIVVSGYFIINMLIINAQIKQEEKVILSVFDFYVTSEYDINEYKTYNVPIIITFGSEESVGCTKIVESLKEINRLYKDKAIIKFVDVWKYPTLAKDYVGNLLPTTIFFDNLGNPYKSTVYDMSLFESIVDENSNVTLTKFIGSLTKDELMIILVDLGVK